MRKIQPFACPVAACLLTVCFAGVTAHAAFAQDADHDWEKSYTITGQPSLTIETADSHLDIHSCGDCKTVHIKVHSGEKLSEFRLEESQSGEHIYFTLKEKPRLGFHMSIHREPTTVTVETPGALSLNARTADGSFTARDLHGDMQIHTGDGSLSLDNIYGNLHLTTSDGNLSLQNASGTLEAHSSDGNMKVDGKFESVQLHTSDGTLDFALTPGSQLTAPSRIESSDGSVNIRLPRNLAANLDISTSDGHIDCSLPVTMDHYDSHEGSGNHIHGKLNAGGVPLAVHSSDGNVTIHEL